MRKLPLAFALLLCASASHAQVRYDLGALASFQQRFLVGAPAGARGIAEGGALTLDGHVAIFPLLRVGAYFTGEVSKPIDGPASAPVTVTSTREILGGGLRVKIVPPWPRGVWRMWIATGFGYDGVVTDRGGGGFFEVPAIVGASYRIRKPVVFLMELGARFGFGFWGSYYDGRAGNDVVSVALWLGFGID